MTPDQIISEAQAHDRRAEAARELQRELGYRRFWWRGRNLIVRLSHRDGPEKRLKDIDTEVLSEALVKVDTYHRERARELRSQVVVTPWDEATR